MPGAKWYVVLVQLRAEYPDLPPLFVISASEEASVCITGEESRCFWIYSKSSDMRALIGALNPNLTVNPTSLKV